jgi:hypothetical protein
MRTTLTIDPDVAQLLAQALERAQKPFKQIVNDALRRGLSAPESPPRKPFKVTPYAMGWDAGLDPTGFNQLIDQLAVDDFLELQQRQDSVSGSKPSSTSTP